ncbi:MAG: flagellar biosynthetic protein FliO [Alphaproteobacteria bacterium]|nr:flagellar biosynthetic protein FliO [Alphaproteobacteria bacterium]
MDTTLLLKFFSAFVFVIALMLLLSWVMKRMGLAGSMMAGAGKRRLKIVEFMPLDHRRRLVLVRRDDREHLLLLGPQGETVVETNIPVAGDNIVEFAKDQKNVQA